MERGGEVALPCRSGATGTTLSSRPTGESHTLKPEHNTAEMTTDSHPSGQRTAMNAAGPSLRIMAESLRSTAGCSRRGRPSQMQRPMALAHGSPSVQTETAPHVDAVRVAGSGAIRDATHSQTERGIISRLRQPHLQPSVCGTPAHTAVERIATLDRARHNRRTARHLGVCCDDSHCGTAVGAGSAAGGGRGAGCGGCARRPELPA